MLWGCGATPFSFYESPDKKQSEWSIAQIGQGGIGLPDRDYYFDEDKEDKRKAYQVLTFLTFPPCIAALGHMHTAHVHVARRLFISCAALCLLQRAGVTYQARTRCSTKCTARQG